MPKRKKTVSFCEPQLKHTQIRWASCITFLFLIKHLIPSLSSTNTIIPNIAFQDNMDKRNIPKGTKCVIYYHCKNKSHNSNRSQTFLGERHGQLTVHLVAVVTAPWRRGSVGWEGSDGRRWILCSCCALLRKEMSRADPNEVDGQGTPMMGGCFVRAKVPAERGGTQDVCLPGSLTTRMREVASPRAVTSRTYTASGRERWKANVKHAWWIN